MSYQTSHIDLTNPIFIIYSLTHILTIISIQIENVEDACNLPGSCNIRRPILSQTRRPTVTQNIPAPPPPPRIRPAATHTVTSSMLGNNNRPLAASTPVPPVPSLDDSFSYLRGPDGQPLIRGGSNDRLNQTVDRSSRRARPSPTRPRSPSPRIRNGNLNMTFIFTNR